MITFTLPRQLPKLPEEPPTSTSLFRINIDTEHFPGSEELPAFRRADDHVLRPCEPIDFTYELNKPDKFFLTSQVLKEYEQKGWERYKKRLLGGLRELSRSPEHIAELFYAGTSIPAFEGVSGDFSKKALDADDDGGTSRSGRTTDELAQLRLHEQLLEDTALSSTLMQEDSLDDNHPLAFRINFNEKKKKTAKMVEMPDSLPNLKGDFWSGGNCGKNRKKKKKKEKKKQEKKEKKKIFSFFSLFSCFFSL